MQSEFSHIHDAQFKCCDKIKTSNHTNGLLFSSVGNVERHSEETPLHFACLTTETRICVHSSNTQSFLRLSTASSIIWLLWTFDGKTSCRRLQISTCSHAKQDFREVSDVLATPLPPDSVNFSWIYFCGTILRCRHSNHGICKSPCPPQAIDAHELQQPN